MRFDLKNRPSRTVGWLVAIAMTFNIVASLFMLLSPNTVAGPSAWVLIVVSILVFAYAVYQIVRKPPPGQAGPR